MGTTGSLNCIFLHVAPKNGWDVGRKLRRGRGTAMVLAHPLRTHRCAGPYGSGASRGLGRQGDFPSVHGCKAPMLSPGEAKGLGEGAVAPCNMMLDLFSCPPEIISRFSPPSHHLLLAGTLLPAAQTGAWRPPPADFCTLGLASTYGR
jgi:hypothetical protein